jgi:hypothetical protein
VSLLLSLKLVFNCYYCFAYFTFPFHCLSFFLSFCLFVCLSSNEI